MRIPATRSRHIAVLDVLSLALLVFALVVFHHTYTARPRSASLPATVSSLRAGDGIAPLPVYAADGVKFTLLDAKDPGWSVLLAFRSDCPACAAQKADWMALAHEARSHGWQVAALTPEPLDKKVRGYFGDAPVRLARVDRGSAAAGALGIRVVPATILVGPGRRVLFVGNGRLNPARLDSVRALLATGSGGVPRP